ncbi:putative O-glycosylation ligase, exosortase A system-associated [Sphingomonas morindae]|uniref:O-glycosylation ligase, exosortase A system-associated n=1 Tax=Sphingomonas morindae TaxID=1541170 RepID=A0ABY4X964_9SPHN|nr:putative O-glycosylation ligase, exosortase A system-associated [Sphingomonas morindae]USI73380.1 putative O-glycosylation ligase, exosortase A system-associated [Sphingomonas morindae]
MRDLFFVGFLAVFVLLGLRRPYLWVLGYVYVDIVSPQRLSYYLLNAVPISLIFFLLALGGWALRDEHDGLRLSGRQALMLMLLGWCGYTTLTADFPTEALEKWSWVWKALTFALFLPVTLRTRLRIEALLLFMVLSAASIIIVGGVKTLASGGGYGMLNLMVDNNAGLYEGSIISTVAVAIIPLILVLARFGTIFPRDARVTLFAAALIFACLLIPIGTQARTGLICIGLLAVLHLRDSRHRLLWMGGMAAAVAVAVPLLPASYTERMNTIQGYQADQSASTRLAVWRWTWDYVQDHPGGGGFNAYLQNRLTVRLKGTAEGDEVAHEKSRAYHSAYFEMLGEQGFFGFGLWLALQLAGLAQMELLRRRFLRSAAPDEAWIAPLAGALQQGHLIYLVGAGFVAIAFQPFVFMLIAAEIGLSQWARRTRPAGTARGFAAAPPVAPWIRPPRST